MSSVWKETDVTTFNGKFSGHKNTLWLYFRVGYLDKQMSSIWESDHFPYKCVEIDIQQLIHDTNL